MTRIWIRTRSSLYYCSFLIGPCRGGKERRLLLKQPLNSVIKFCASTRWLRATHFRSSDSEWPRPAECHVLLDHYGGAGVAPSALMPSRIAAFQGSSLKHGRYSDAWLNAAPIHPPERPIFVGCSFAQSADTPYLLLGSLFYMPDLLLIL